MKHCNTHPSYNAYTLCLQCRVGLCVRGNADHDHPGRIYNHPEVTSTDVDLATDYAEGR